MTDDRLKNLCDGLRDAALTAAFMEDMFRRCVAISMAGFWHDCYPVLGQMVSDIVPQAMALESALTANPELRGREEDIMKGAMAVKAENPAGSYEENLLLAISKIKGANG